MDNFKTRISLTIPTPIYNLLDTDSKKYGIAKSTIVSGLLFLHYSKENNNADFSNIGDLIKK